MKKTPAVGNNLRGTGIAQEEEPNGGLGQAFLPRHQHYVKKKLNLVKFILKTNFRELIVVS